MYIEKGAVLQGMVPPEDYLPMILNRFEGWELKTYTSFLNGGTSPGMHLTLCFTSNNKLL